MSTEPSVNELYQRVMTVPAPAVESEFDSAQREFLFGHVWNRTALSIRDRRIVALACVAASDGPGPTDDYVYAALNSGDLSIEQLNELTLQFAVYCGWPKASYLEGVVRTQWRRIYAERGEEAPTLPLLGLEDLGPDSHEERMRLGTEEFISVNLTPAPPSNSAYFHAGILNFVFGHVWRRPGLSRRDRRLITLVGVGDSCAHTPILTHVASALESGDISWDEMQEIVLTFSAYCGEVKAEALRDAAERWREKT